MTEDLLERLSAGRIGEPPPSLELRCDRAPPSGSLEVPRRWTTTLQGAGDLGVRLERAARSSAGNGVARLAIVGSDAPLLPLPTIETAFEALEAHDAAIAPAADGGYVLLALAVRRVPPPSLRRLFAGIPWGTGRVLHATRAAARAAGISLAELPPHWDVDRPADLTRLRREIAALPGPPLLRRTADILRGLRRLPSRTTTSDPSS